MTTILNLARYVPQYCRLPNTVYGYVETSGCEQFNALPWSLAQYGLHICKLLVMPVYLQRREELHCWRVHIENLPFVYIMHHYELENAHNNFHIPEWWETPLPFCVRTLTFWCQSNDAPFCVKTYARLCAHLDHWLAKNVWNKPYRRTQTYILRPTLLILLLRAFTTHLRVLASSFLRFRDHTITQHSR